MVGLSALGMGAKQVMLALALNCKCYSRSGSA